MPDSAAIIGKIAVKVIPDTDKFKGELKKKLDGIEKELRSEKYSVKVAVELDGSKIAQDAKKIQADAKKNLTNITLRVNVKEQDSLLANIARINAELKKLDEVSVSVKLNKADLEAKLAEWEAKLAEIHHITVRVNKKDLKSVTSAIAQIDAELKKLAEEEIPVKLNKASLEKARADLQETLDFAAWEATHKADQALKESIQRSQLLINRVNGALNDIKWAPGVDEAKLAAAKREVELTLHKIEGLAAQIKVEVDPVAKRKLELEMEALRARINTIKANVKAEVDKTAKARTKAALDILGHDREVSFKPVLNNRATTGFLAALSRLSGYRGGHQFVDDLKSMLFNLDLAIPKIGTVATSIGGIGAAALSSSAYLFALSASLASIGAGALALPGIFGGLAIGLIATAVVLKDFNKQFSELRVGLGKKQTAGSWWKELQKQMSSNFWSIAKQPIQEMVYTLFPLLSQGLQDTSTALGGWFSGLATGLKNALGPRMQQMFSYLNQSIWIATDSTGSLATSIGVLGSLGASYLPRLAQWFTDIAKKTADWLVEAEKTGRLKELVDNAIKSLKNLGNVLVGVVGIFGDIARASKKALGEDALTKLARGVDRLHSVTKSADFQKELVDVFKAANTAMKNIVRDGGPALEDALKNLAHLARDSFGDIGATIGQMVGGIADAFNNSHLQSSARVFFTALRNFAEDLRPAWDAVGGAIGSVLDLISVFISTASPGVATAIQNLAGWIGTLADALKPIVEGLGKALSDTLDRIAPGITRIVNAIKTFAQGDGGKAIVGFFQDLSPLIGDIADWLGKAATQLAKWGDENLPKIRDNLKPVIDDFRQFLADHGQTMIDTIKGIGNVIVGLTGFLKDLSPAVADLVVAGSLLLLAQRLTGVNLALAAIKLTMKNPTMGIAAFLGLAAIGVFMTADANGDGPLGYIGKLREILTTPWVGEVNHSKTIDDLDASLTNFWMNLKQNYFDFGDWIREKTGEVTTEFSRQWDNAWSDFGTQFESFKTTTSEGWGQFWSTTTEKVGTGVETVKTTFSLGVEYWKQKIGDGLYQIGLFFADLPNNIQRALGSLRETVGQKFSEALTYWKSTFGVKLEEVKQFFRDLPGNIITSLGQLGSLLVANGKLVIQGFLDGLQAKWETVKGWFKNITSSLPFEKGPPAKDKVILFNAGELVMQGFLNGLESKYDAVRDSLKGLTNEIGATDMGALAMPGVAVGRRIGGIANGAMAERSVNQKILNYYAAPGSSISAEEDLFAAAGRSRMGAF